MNGPDVKSLTDLLVKNLYLNKNDITTSNGKTVYNASVKKAVIRFQNDANLSATGNTDAITVQKLKAWDSSKTTIVLGVRDLSIGDAGTDVAELIKLLTKAGYAPDPKKLEYIKEKPKMTEDIVMAVKMFQAYNKLTVSGNVDSATLTKLRSFAQ
jgi:peptidoglycan hydrolase-like protein with peptidoglycan-binding domain